MSSVIFRKRNPAEVYKIKWKRKEQETGRAGRVVVMRKC